MSTTQQYCTFHLGDLFLGMEVEGVQEVLRGRQMTRVPLAPDVIAGLMNLRGQIVPVLDLRRRFGLGEREAGVATMNVVVQWRGSVVSLLVDRIGDVVEPPPDSFEPPPELIDPATRRLLRCVCKLEGSLLLIVDAEAVMSFGASAVWQDPSAASVATV